MSRFTFAKGNAEKVIALPLYALGAMASAIVPRKKGLWAFGSGSGVGEGALALALEARAADSSLTIRWLARNVRDRTDAARHRLTSVPLTSWHGFWITLRAEVLVVTHGFGDVNRFGTRGGFIVQLWHGIPLKLIHLDSPATMRSPILDGSAVVRRALGAMYRRAANGISLFPAASPVAAARLASAFGLPDDRIVVTGDPRDDTLSRGTPQERRAAAREKLARLLGSPHLADPDFTGTAPRIVLFAPTWRDGAADPVIPSADEWAAIADQLERSNATLLVRPHPLGVGDYRDGPATSPRIRFFTSQLQQDITPLLPAFDVLITDYSSIAYDFALTGGPMLYLAPDVVAYTTSRGLYEPYAEFSGGREVTSWTDLLAQLDRLDSDPAFAAALVAHSDAVATRHHSFRDGRNTARVYSEIVSRLKGAV
ncbi:MAG: CDP-glycerol glycerophosphotransferase family protein [Glaciihabitans sp.]